MRESLPTEQGEPAEEDQSGESDQNHDSGNLDGLSAAGVHK